MAVTYTNVDSPATRFMQSFVNLTQINPTRYPQLTSMRLEYGDTATVPTTAYYIFDQWAFRTISVSATP